MRYPAGYFWAAVLLTALAVILLFGCRPGGQPASVRPAEQAGQLPEIYVSTDVEADGPIPGPHSMVSFASAAFTRDQRLVATFSANLEPLPGATVHPVTQAWWRKYPEAWKAVQTNRQPPDRVMADYVRWLKQLPGRPVFVGYPATYDFMFIYWYLMSFEGESPFAIYGLDAKSFAMAMLHRDFHEVSRKTMPERWFGGMRHSHLPLDDALEQGHLFLNMLRERDARRPPRF